MREPTESRASAATDRRICRMIFDEICVLANGDVVCSCADPAAKHVYGNVLREPAGEIFDGPGYRSMRRWQLAAPPSSWCPTTSAPCGGRISRPTSADRTTDRRVRTLQLEPISRCNLACPACPVSHFRDDPAYRPSREAQLALETMLGIVDQLPDLEKLLFYNFGEPFLHPRAIEFLRAVRARRPEVLIDTSTNGLALTPDKIESIAADALLDRIVFSIDGARAASYARYRVGGSLERGLGALEALAAACRRHGTDRRVEIVWQYILFEWNDGADEIAEARARAAAIGVPLRFVVTHTEGASRRFRPGAPELVDELGCRDPWALLTCDLRRADLDRNAGVAAGRFLARVAARPRQLVSTAGRRFALLVELENPTDHRWRRDEHRLGFLLRNRQGRSMREMAGVPIDGAILAPHGKGFLLVDQLAPTDPGDYELLLDVVEDGVAWFHERGSAPVILPLRVEPKSRAFPDLDRVAEPILRACTRRQPAAEEATWVRSALAAGHGLENLLVDLAAYLPEDDRKAAVARGRLAAARSLGLL